ncbi:MAG: SH3 domain-containing protein [Chloroflexota bacterium]
MAHLTLRREPRVVNETLIRYVTLDEVMQVIDADNPLAKIGVKGQWLQVRTAGGTEGYVAAWFVERVQG